MSGRSSQGVGNAAMMMGIALAVGFLFLPDMPIAARAVGIAMALLFAVLGIGVRGGNGAPLAGCGALRKAVRDLAPTYFAGLGYRTVKDEAVACGGGSVVELEHGTVHFYFHKTELGSYVRLRAGGRAIEESVGEVTMPRSTRGVQTDVEKLMQQIADSYRPIYKGEATEWPRSTYNK